MGIRDLVKKWIGNHNSDVGSTDVAVMERSENVFFNSDEEVIQPVNYEVYYNMIEQEVELTSTVLSSQYDGALASDIVKVEIDGIPVFIERNELEFKAHQLPLMRYVGEEIRFQLVNINEKEGWMLGSAKKIKEKEFDLLHKELKEGKIFEAELTKNLRYGAYFLIGNTSVQMLNKDFAEDHSTIGDILTVGDTIKVRFNRITENKNLRVEPIVKYKNETSVSLENMEANQVVLGTVRSIKKWGIFVRIAPNLDALCSIPTHIEIKDGDTVSFRITQVLKEDKRVRGKIVRLVKKD